MITADRDPGAGPQRLGHISEVIDIGDGSDIIWGVEGIYRLTLTKREKTEASAEYRDEYPGGPIDLERYPEDYKRWLDHHGLGRVISGGRRDLMTDVIRAERQLAAEIEAMWNQGRPDKWSSSGRGVGQRLGSSPETGTKPESEFESRSRGGQESGCSVSVGGASKVEEVRTEDGNRSVLFSVCKGPSGVTTASTQESLKTKAEGDDTIEDKIRQSWSSRVLGKSRSDPPNLIRRTKSLTARI